MYYADDPITKPEEDRFGRNVFVDKLSNDITKWKGEDKSLVIALYGHWGTGKSSVLNLLKRELNKNQANNVLSFDPWYFNSTERLIQTFLELLSKKVSEKANQVDKESIRKKFDEYKSSLSNIFSSISWEPELEFPIVFGKIKVGIPKKKKEVKRENPETIKNELSAILKKLKSENNNYY